MRDLPRLVKGSLDADGMWVSLGVNRSRMTTCYVLGQGRKKKKKRKEGGGGGDMGGKGDLRLMPDHGGRSDDV